MGNAIKLLQITISRLIFNAMSTSKIRFVMTFLSYSESTGVDQFSFSWLQKTESKIESISELHKMQQMIVSSRLTEGEREIYGRGERRDRNRSHSICQTHSRLSANPGINAWDMLPRRERASQLPCYAIPCTHGLCDVFNECGVGSWRGGATTACNNWTTCRTLW